MKTISILRVIRGWRQWDLSVKAGIPNYRLCKIERGKVEPTDDELSRIADALEVSKSDLRTEIKPETLFRTEDREENTPRRRLPTRGAKQKGK